MPCSCDLGTASHWAASPHGVYLRATTDEANPAWHLCLRLSERLQIAVIDTCGETLNEIIIDVRLASMGQHGPAWASICSTALARGKALSRILVEIGQTLGSYRGKFAVIGGAVPWLLLEDSEMQHVGTLDIDLSLNAEALAEDKPRHLSRCFKWMSVRREVSVEDRSRA